MTDTTLAEIEPINQEETGLTKQNAQQKNKTEGTLTELPKDYVTVSDRVEQFHKKYPNGSISTMFLKKGAVYYFIARVIPNIEYPSRYFTGSSFGDMSEQRSFEKNEKVFEKLETVAIGRALVFAGFDAKLTEDKNTETRTNITNKQAKESKIEPKAKSQSITQPQINLIQNKLKKLEIAEANWLGHLKQQYQVSVIEQLSKYQGSQIILELNDLTNIQKIKNNATPTQ